MKETRRFYKEENKWYIDLPEWIEQGLPKDDLEMVLGADTLLDGLSNNGDEVTLTFSDSLFNEFKMELSKVEEDEYGSTYIVTTFYEPMTVWLCPVTRYVFNDVYPEKIYISLN